MPDVHAGSHVVQGLGVDDDHPMSRVALMMAADSASGTRGLEARSGTVTLAFDRVDGPMRVTLDVAVSRQTAVPLMCISIGGEGSLAEMCTCQREDGSSFECMHSDRKESVCCVTNDPETMPLRATFTTMPCVAE